MRVDLIPKGSKNRPAGKNTMRYITLHDTGNPAKTATAASHAKYLKSEPSVSWHYTVDETEVVQHLPDTESAWHTGTSRGNTSSIGVEVCIGGDLKKAYDNAAALIASLCRKHNIPVEHVVQHNFWNGKDCPKTMRAGNPYSFSEFLARVKANLAGADAPSPWAKEAWEKGKSLGITDGSRPKDVATREEVVAMILRSK